MKPFLISITGGSGAGKTALAKELKRHFGRKASIFHMDNYQRFGEKLPKLHGMKNWDCPAAIKWDELIRDITSLKDGKVITIKTRAQKKLKRPKKVTFVPTEIVVVEGYFLFYKKSLRCITNT